MNGYMVAKVVYLSSCFLLTITLNGGRAIHTAVEFFNKTNRHTNIEIRIYLNGFNEMAALHVIGCAFLTSTCLAMVLCSYTYGHNLKEDT
jgi:hypothetical protein